MAKKLFLSMVALVVASNNMYGMNDWLKKLVHKKNIEYVPNSRTGNPWKDKEFKRIILSGDVNRCSNFLKAYQQQFRPTPEEFTYKIQSIYKKKFAPRAELKLPSWYPVIPGFFLTTTALSIGYSVVAECLPNNPRRESLDKIIAVVMLGSFVMTYVTGKPLFVDDKVRYDNDKAQLDRCAEKKSEELCRELINQDILKK